MKLWVDDERPAPDGWTHARTLDDFLYYLYTSFHTLEEIALDHDLGRPKFRDADVIASLIESLAYGDHIRRLKWQILSNNPAGIKKIRAALENADKYWTKWENERDSLSELKRESDE